jgi:D-arabinose 1-dehydrogenase-like Zn-dependent alcohol dehydrogenase
MMKALVLGSVGEKPQLQLRDVAAPTPGENDVLVRVAACGICYHDVAVVDGTLRRGIKPELILGHEVSGVVFAVGDGVTSAKPGDRVVATLTTFCGECPRCNAGNEYRCLYGRGFGHALDAGFAQYMSVPQSAVIPIPDSLDLVQASLLACPIGVSVSAIEDAARLRSGETALVVGAGGGLGAHLAQVAVALGARVLAVTTSPDKLSNLEALPGVETILADSELDFSEIVLALTEDSGADVVLNPVGSALFGSCIASAAQFGRMIVLGEIAGHAARFNLAELLFRDATVTGSTGASPRHIRKAIDLVASGAVKPILSQQFAFDEAQQAIEQMRDGNTFGRVALIPPN